MNERNFGHLGASFQQGLLKTIIEDRKFAVTIIDVVESKYFDGPYFKYIMENIKELYKLYGCIPNYDTLQQKIMKENKDATGKVNLDTLAAIRDMELENSGYIKDTSLNFCRQQVLKKSLKDVEEIMNNGAFEDYNKIEGIVQRALQVGVTIDEIKDVCHNVREALQKDSRVPFPTGIVGMDNLLKGGLARGELAIFLAPTGIGKTTWLTKVANTAYNVGANVLQIFFEDNMNDILRKHYTIWTGIASDDQPANEEEIVKKVEEVSEGRSNFIKLLKLPAFGVSIADIKSKIRKLESEGFMIDLLILDYIDCISLENKIDGEEWKGEGTIMRSLESMTDEFNIAIWTATQGNRDSMSAEVVTTDQMGGNIKKAQIGHVVISAAKTLEQKEHNLANLTLLKSRIGKDGIIFQNCKFDNEYLQIDTDTQNTLLGHEEERVERKKQRAAEVYKASLESKSKTKRKVEAEVDKLIERKNIIMTELHELEHGKEVAEEISPIGEKEIVDNVIEAHKDHELVPVQSISPPKELIEGLGKVLDKISDEPKTEQPLGPSQEELNRRRAAEVFKQRKLAEQQKKLNTG